jgi:subtilase family serine protease
MALKAISVISFISLLLLGSSLAGNGALASLPGTDIQQDEINGPGGLLSTSGLSIQSPNQGNPLQMKEHHPAHVKKFIGPLAVALSGGDAPATILSAYGFNNIGCTFTTTTDWTNPNLCGHGQTIAIVDAYNDPNIASDLTIFDTQFGLPACTVANGCFTTNPQGTPSTDSGWALEISLDVQWAHSIAPGAKIVLVESADSTLGNLLTGVDTAVGTGAQQVSNSWGGSEFSTESSYDYHYNSAKTSFFVSSGDGGHGVYWPAASPYVVSVGGTTLTTGTSGNWVSETAWADSGGGTSTYEPKPSYQNNFNTNSKRTVPDVAYDGNPNTGVYVYDSVPISGNSGWWIVGGTSAGAPQWAAISAIANSKNANLASASFGTSNALYGAASGSQYLTNYHDITSGSNGNCGAVCNAAVDYDEVTGLGSPQANNLVLALTLPPVADFAISANPSSFAVTAGSPQTSTITVTSLNGFSGTVSLSSSTGSNLGSTSVNVSPSATGSTTLTFTPAVSATYTVTGTSGSLAHTASIPVTISTPLSVSVISTGTTFTQGTTASFTVSVTSNSTPVSGASVTLKVTASNGSTAQGTGTTNTGGQVTFKYSISRNAPTGTYTASATAAKSGYLSGSGSETFVVTAASIHNGSKLG